MKEDIIRILKRCYEEFEVLDKDTGTRADDEEVTDEEIVYNPLDGL